MTGNNVEQIVIRHLSGSKANQIEHITLSGVTEITIGRDPASKIAFDSSRDDVVSRRHAVIRVIGGNQISFRLADIGSNNGTFLNGKQIAEDVELLPEDVIELGKNGVKFVFDVQPRPAYLVARTRIIDVSDVAATRVIKAAEIAASTAVQDVVAKSDISVEPAMQKFEPPPKVGVGKETVLHMLGEERRATSRVWISSLGGLAVLVALGGGAFYWKHRAELKGAKEEIVKQEAGLESKLQQQQAEHEKELAELRQQQADEQKKAAEGQKKFAEERGLSAQEIADKFGNATAEINRRWRLYDQTTSRPIFHLVVHLVIKGQPRTLPAYVRLPGPNGTVVRWLTLEDDMRRNIPIGGEAFGTGFAVNEQGFILTNKHLAAPWNLRYGPVDPAAIDYKFGLLFEYYFPESGKKAKKARKAKNAENAENAQDSEDAQDSENAQESENAQDSDNELTRKKARNRKIAKKPNFNLVGVIELNDDKYFDLWNWVPASGGLIFRPDVPTLIGTGNIPDPSSSGNRTFFGRNDKLEVQFANSRGHSNASLVNFSEYSDAALIKVDTPTPLKILDIAKDDTVTVGESVIALGFPGVASEVFARSETIENQQYRKVTDIVPQPFVTEGIVSVISPAVKTENGVTYGGKSGDVIQMSINATGAGNSGGPVFNKKGVVIGLFTYGRQYGGAQTTEAIPIKYGRDLLMSQHP